MSLAIKVLVALILGLAAGLGATHLGATGDTLANALQPVGTLWVAAIRMAIIPLVVSSLLIGVGGAADTKTVTVLGARGLGVFVVLLALAAAFSLLLGPPIFARLAIDPAAAESLRNSASQAGASMVEGARQLPSVAQWFVDLVPVNPVKAAADGALLPLIVFSVAMGAALTRIDRARREALLGVMRAVQEASLAIMRFVLAFAPIGVFALAFVLATRVGIAAAGALATYIAVVCAACTAFCALVMYPLASVWGRIPIGEFARALLPSQAVAFSGRSSLAAFPAMLEAARGRLDLSEPVIDFLMPVMITMFRVGAVIAMMIGAMFIARLYGVPLGPVQYLTLGLVSLATSFSVPGIPSGSIIMMVPVMLAVGLPAEGVGVLLAVDTIPDMFRTATNVTADLATGVVMDRARAERRGTRDDG
ncbi:MAG TPA: dicarboxylate/amino acid:cation symporter [Gemmatimonadaceae bacterium]|nr:dicarboxylate/amino acid:cation symporter [Gemmatimonadaceae bacterium]